MFNSEYNDKRRWISYYHQTRLIMEKKPKSVLEIGVGEHTLEDILKRKGIKYEGMDLERKTTYKGNIVNWVPKKDYDIICCFQTLEHIELKQAKEVIKRLRKYCKWLIISIPQNTFHLEINGKGIAIPKKTNKCQSNQHKWEMGYIGIEWNLGTGFFDIENPYHLFYTIKGDL